MQLGNEPPLRPNVDESPLPDHLVDMLREGGVLDSDGNPIHTYETTHPYYDEDVYATGSERQRDADATADEDHYSDVPDGRAASMTGGILSSPDEYGLMDTTVNEAAFSYGFPVEFFLDMLTRWDVTPPIDQDVRLGDLITAEQAFALGEALTGLDPADVRDNYLDDRIEDLAIELDMPLPDLLQACAANKINLPQGSETHITIDEYKTLLDAVMDDGPSSSHRRSFDDNRMRHHWFGKREIASRLAVQALEAEAYGPRDPRNLWKDGPPVVGLGQNQIHPDQVHITGRIFGEELFKRGAQASDDEDLFDFHNSEDDDEEWGE